MRLHPEVFFYHPAGCPYLSREFSEGLQEGCPFSGNRRKKNFRMGIIGRKPAEKTEKFGRCAHCTGAAAVL